MRLLQQSRGAAAGETTAQVPGFLFDMNRFWQACIGRFLGLNLPAVSGRVVSRVVV